MGYSYGNSLAETINGFYRAKLIQSQAPWKSFETFEMATLFLGDWFNDHRLIEPTGNISLAEDEGRYFPMQQPTSISE